jgi:dihydrodipicolinate synthase/N-acetylneuraminate lyase
MTMTRRLFLACTPAVLVAGGKPELRGIFPILQTPFTGSDQLDIKSLVTEAQAMDRWNVPGMVWPQLASEWSTLSPDERTTGAEALASIRKKLKTALVLGVQGPDTEAAVQYARHAAKLEPDAIIAIPPKTDREADLMAYYEAIAAECSRPLFIQAIGNVSVDFILKLAEKIPTLQYVKDEAGHTLSRLVEFRRRAPDLKIFTGAHGRTLLDEMERGSAGDMPAASFPDLYQKAWNQWTAGNKEQAMQTFSLAAMLVHQVSAYGLASLKYILHLRGVFPNWKVRGGDSSHFDDLARESISKTWAFAKKRGGLV